MAGPAGSFNVSRALTALGLRDVRVIPALKDSGTVVATISFGEFETFVGEVIEARGLLNDVIPGLTLGSRWSGVKMLSVAPGGSIIEVCAVEALIVDQSRWPWYFANIAPTDPWPGIGLTISPLTIGGQALVNLLNRVDPQVGDSPKGNNFGGSFTGPRWPVFQASDGEAFTRIWVPAGWWFWLATESTGAPAIPVPDQRFILRWREIPQAQGAA